MKTLANRSPCVCVCLYNVCGSVCGVKWWCMCTAMKVLASRVCVRVEMWCVMMLYVYSYEGADLSLSMGVCACGYVVCKWCCMCAQLRRYRPVTLSVRVGMRCLMIHICVQLGRHWAVTLTVHLCAGGYVLDNDHIRAPLRRYRAVALVVYLCGWVPSV